MTAPNVNWVSKGFTSISHWHATPSGKLAPLCGAKVPYTAESVSAGFGVVTCAKCRAKLAGGAK